MIEKERVIEWLEMTGQPSLRVIRRVIEHMLQDLNLELNTLAWMMLVTNIFMPFFEIPGECEEIFTIVWDILETKDLRSFGITEERKDYVYDILIGIVLSDDVMGRRYYSGTEVLNKFAVLV